jgi:hypothetical protein
MMTLPRSPRTGRLTIPPLPATVLVVALVVVFLAVRGGTGATTSPTLTPSAVHVVYELVSPHGGVDSADITYATPSGQSQQNGVDVPLDPGLTQDVNAGTWLYLSAQIRHGRGQLTCRIVANGITIAENTASGDYAITTCSGTA